MLVLLVGRLNLITEMYVMLILQMIILPVLRIVQVRGVAVQRMMNAVFVMVLVPYMIVDVAFVDISQA